MGILFLDSSSRQIEFGYAKDLEIIIKEKLDSNDNADTLTYFIKCSFNKHKLKFKDIDIVSLSNGPGSFTGLRISSAIAKGICFVNGSKLIEISTLDLIANKYKTDNKLTSLIFSNSRSLEFYYCLYIYNSGKLNRISDYKMGILEEIFDINSIYVINECVSAVIPSLFRNKLIDVSKTSNLDSQFELTKEYIQDNRYTNFRTSEPFYMKEFEPKI